MKECRDIVRELVAMFESGAFEIGGRRTEYGVYDYFAFDGGLTYDGLVFRLDGEDLDIELTSAEGKSIAKAFSKAIDRHIINEGSWDGFKAIEDYLGF